MALQLSVDTLDGVDEALHSLYTPKDGRFVLDVDGIEDTSGLKKALDAERKRADAEAKQAKAWKTLGKTPAEIEELLESQRKAEEDKLNKAGEWDKLRAQMNEKHQAELAKKDEALGGMRKALERHLVDATATAAIAAADGVPDLLLPHVQKHVRVIEDNGEFSVKVVDAKGDPRVNAKGDLLAIADLVSEMKTSDIYGRAFKGSGQSGSGTPPGPGGGGTLPNKRRSEMSSKERADFVDTHGLDAYKALPT